MDILFSLKNRGLKVIYDCFTFFNELELLEIRLHELSPVVDRFVLVEATRTHSNHEKPLYFDLNKGKFKQFLPKIIHIVVSDFPTANGNRWVFENYQRNAISRGLRDCEPDDVIVVSDIDEIVRPQAILENKDRPGIKFFRQRLYYYFLNCECINNIWDAPKMAFYRDMHTPQWLRKYPNPFYPKKWQRSLSKRIIALKQIVGTKDVFIDEGGWHFSYLGGIDRVRQKIKAFAHSEYDSDKFLNPINLLERIQNSEDIFGRKYNYRFVPIDASFPRYLQLNIERFKELIQPWRTT